MGLITTGTRRRGAVAVVSWNVKGPQGALGPRGKAGKPRIKLDRNLTALGEEPTQLEGKVAFTQGPALGLISCKRSQA